MNNTEFVQVLNSCDNLVKEPASFRFLDPLVLNYKIKKLSTACVLHDKVELFRSLDYLIELNDVRMPDQLQYMYLSGDPLDVADILDFLLLKYFYCDFFSSKVVVTELHLAKCALSNGLAKDVMADIFELRLRLTR